MRETIQCQPYFFCRKASITLRGRRNILKCKFEDAYPLCFFSWQFYYYTVKNSCGYFDLESEIASKRHHLGTTAIKITTTIEKRGKKSNGRVIRPELSRWNIATLRIRQQWVSILTHWRLFLYLQSYHPKYFSRFVSNINVKLNL